MLTALDSISVLIYGILIMAFFLDLKATRRNIIILSIYVFLSSILQYSLYYVHGAEIIEKLYPILIHFPLVLLFCTVYKRRLNLVLFVLFTAYMFTSPRRWVGEAMALVFNNEPSIVLITKIITSILLLIVIYKYLKPHVNRILEYPNPRITLLAAVPTLSYFLVYATTVYTEALYNSSIVFVGIFSVGFNSVFFVFIIAYFIEMNKNYESQTEQTILKMQNDMILVQLEDYKSAQRDFAVYRHDLRHHLHYLSNCISEKHTDEALNYITEINSDIEATYVDQYCENTNVNLILSAYAAKAKTSMDNIDIIADVPTNIPIQATDICVILSNGIENAIHACNLIPNRSDRKIRVSCQFDHKKLLIEICNSYEGEIHFEEDIPTSNEANHGLGIKSIMAIAKKYNGICAFTEEEGIFKMRAILS
ncbi:sensor histidine kinase [Fusibacter sp. 3D3]|uniref:sensor histidine kinase n=1 Tax=Fusibacter sp. 3D3 TaxID=1048380 RepID=UPI000852A017|nr:ATP-binding protein [Fusibacter sp. 3D3]GAU79213.1 sensor histidine kinase [Fusibacter sp. 3D3]